MNKKFAPIPLAVTLTMAATLVGCGGSGGGLGTVANPYAGSYTSAMTLDGGKSGTLALTVSSTGTAIGTLAVAAGAAATRSRDGGSFSFSIGSHDVSGTVGSDGTISLTGTDNGTGAGSFSINGSFTSTGSGTVNVLAGGSTFGGTISASTGGGGTGSSITLTNAAGANADLSNYPDNPFILMSTVGGASAIVVAPPGGGNARTLTLLLSADAVAGSTVTYDGGNFSANNLTYAETAAKSWRATAGTATIVARGADTFELKFNNVTMTAVADSGATGTFTLNGTLKK